MKYTITEAMYSQGGQGIDIYAFFPGRDLSWNVCLIPGRETLVHYAGEAQAYVEKHHPKIANYLNYTDSILESVYVPLLEQEGFSQEGERRYKYYDKKDWIHISKANQRTLGGLSEQRASTVLRNWWYSHESGETTFPDFLEDIARAAMEKGDGWTSQR